MKHQPTKLRRKLWVDDLRPPPDAEPGRFGEAISEDWIWVKTSDAAIEFLDQMPFDEISFDHDLGGDDTTRPVVLWMCEYLGPKLWPKAVTVHSSNPPGSDWILGTCRRYAPPSTSVSRRLGWYMPL
jgi:hypothetical protein